MMTEQRSGPQSAASTPTPGVVKKKISLSDYKTKAKVGGGSHDDRQGGRKVVAAPAPTPADAPRSSAVKSAEDRSQNQRNATVPAKPSAQSTPADHGLKRPTDADVDKKDSAIQSPKRRRLSTDKPNSQEPRRSKPATNGLPVLLSPTLPPASSTPKLPRLLSPTLPPDIEEALAKLEEGGSPPLGAGASSKRPPSNISTAGKENLARSRPAERNHVRPPDEASPGSRPSRAQIKTTSTPFGRRKNEFEEPRQKDETVQSTKTITGDAKATTSSNFPKFRYIVKLKYGKINRRRVEALLRFSGKRRPALDSSSARVTSDTEGLRTRSEDPPLTENSSRNRQTSKEDRLEKQQRNVPPSNTSHPVQGSKEAGNAPAVEGIKTPVSHRHAPNAASQIVSDARPFTLTPGKDARGAPLRRTVSYDSEAGALRQHATNLLPPPAEAEKGVKQSSSPPVDEQTSQSRHHGDRRAWKDESQKYSTLGRELKHAAERYCTATTTGTTNQNDGGGAADENEKSAVATRVEAILCFILAFIADDQAKTSLGRPNGDSSTWQSILAYWRVVKKSAVPYPPLHSLCLLLGAVSYDAIHALDLERLAVTPLPSDHDPVPTPGSDGNTVVSDESRRSRKEFLDLKTRLPECFREAQKLWLEGSRGLADDVLAREFPSTWSRRSRRGGGGVGIVGEQQQLRIGDFSGDFILPFGKTTAPIEVVRFGWSLLSEWCKKESVPWTGRLGPGGLGAPVARAG